MKFIVINESGLELKATSEVIWLSFKTFVFFSCGIYLLHENFIKILIRKRGRKKGKMEGREKKRDGGKESNEENEGSGAPEFLEEINRTSRRAVHMVWRQNWTDFLEMLAWS